MAIPEKDFLRSAKLAETPKREMAVKR